ncbi:DUF5665 domain-containing protein [Alisedimentitalea sp. MJ-SS2]|uniref:DUF5665 domain-containing protein n=1 Tax=Aliisedimentitalea sp. MJ-SS2 TaxID=3049795 RepID=UPI00290EF972|nr:DUF5665 domain-containing protein [Alisedimentitalea sp. MJ-SS2]MDU8929545.1 DUF5665 domain-containing protein [Alisedimentitalea sp. MJ-SS2]
MSSDETHDDPQLHAINRLTQEVERLNTHRFVTMYNSRWRLIAFSLFRGLAFGLGSVLGATILVSILGWWIAQFEFIPIIGDWAARLVQEIESAQ